MKIKMKTFKEAFGRRLKELRKNRKYTQEQVAELLDLNQRQITRIETGDNFPSVDTLEKLCLLLDVHPKYLFEFDWQYKVAYAKTGTYDSPVLKLVRKNEVMTVKSKSPILMEEFKNKKQIQVSESEQSMLDMAKKVNKPLTVEYFSGKVRTHIKVYYPTGKIETLLTEEDVQHDKMLDSVLEKVKSLPQEQLEFVNLAMQALQDKESLNKLKMLMKGVELTL